MSLAVFTMFVGVIIAPGHLDPLLAAIAILAIVAGQTSLICGTPYSPLP
jgi:protoheme IX farnesyltransferase